MQVVLFVKTRPCNKGPSGMVFTRRHVRETTVLNGLVAGVSSVLSVMVKVSGSTAERDGNQAWQADFQN